MGMNIVDVAKKAKEIVIFDHKVFCGNCNDRQFSPFDKLYTEAYGMCYMCDTDEGEIKSKNILSIVESEL